MIKMMMFYNILIILSLSFLISLTTAQTPPFQYPNDYNYRLLNSPEYPLVKNGEYGSTYRCYRGTPNYNFGMSFCFINTTRNAYTLALGTGVYPNYPIDDPGYWVWAANPNKPVREGAGVFLLPDGNLVLYDVDGQIAWQSNTSTPSTATDFRATLATRTDDMYGNMVLVNAADDVPYWQSFEHPTYTLFPNQILYSAGAEIDKIVSYRSNLGGRHIMMVSTSGISLYYKGANKPKPLLYYTLFKTTKSLKHVKFINFQNGYPYFVLTFADGTEGTFEKFPSALTGSGDYEVITKMFLRIEPDGNIKIFAEHQDESKKVYWNEAFRVFDKGGVASNAQETECQLPEKCGNFGICNNDACVACPLPTGLVPWTDKCKPPVLVGCSNAANVTYYKIEGVEHFVSKYTRGQKPIVQSMCEKKCSVDCKCLGYFYHNETSECWAVSDLKTLTLSKSANSQHFGYVKLTN